LNKIAISSRREPDVIVKNAEPFLYPGSSTGCLLIHGFTGSPMEMRPLGNYLSDQGFTVLGVRLTGHATKIGDLKRTRWEDWSASVLDGWNLLSSITDTIFLIGLSMGGVLALYHASFLPAQGVIALSTPYRIEPGLRLTLLPILSKFISYVPKGESDWQDPNAHENHFSYDRYPTKAILELTKLLATMRDSLPRVKAPAMLMHSKKDLGVIPENMNWIYQDLGTPEIEKKKIWLENSGHVVTRDLDKNIVFESVLDFINQVQGSRQ
jgi:carboxylesterase